MILLHGEFGSGKSRALRELEADPPKGWRSVYVPVSSLELEDLARWSLDRLGAPAGAAEPVAALSAAVAAQPVALLIDDAECLPLATALGLRKLERERPGALSVVAACAPESAQAPAVLALGAPAERIAVGRGGASPSDAVERVRARVGGETRRNGAPRAALASTPLAAAPAPSAPEQRAAPAAPAAAVAPPAPQEERSATAPDPAPRTPEPVVAQAPSSPSPRAGRAVPLWLAVSFAVAAFLLPVAFGAGFWLGRDVARAERLPTEPEAPATRAAPSATAELAAVSAPPPEVVAAETAEPVVLPASEPARPADAAPPRPTRRSTARPVAQPEAEPEAEPAAHSVAEEWGTPTLLRVGPADGS